MAKVFPVRKSFDAEKGKWRKHPAVPKGVHWAEYEASERELSHSANLGCVIPEGVVVIDLDTYKGVTREVVDTVLGHSLPWDDALIQRTVSGGEHYAFTLPEGVIVRQSDSVLGVEGFDTRAAGKGWICTGEGYDDCTLIGMPDALYEEAFPELPAEVVERLNQAEVADDFDALEQAVNNQPIEGIGLEEAERYVMRLPVEDLNSYSTWLKPGMALYHQFNGSDDAKGIWHRWSRQAGDGYDAAEIESKWPTFGKREHISKPTRFDYVIHRAGGRIIERAWTAQDMIEKAAKVDSHEAYERIKREVVKTPLAELPEDARQMVAKALYDAFAKGAGITLGGVRKALQPPKKRKKDIVPSDGGNNGLFSDWVYVETLCEFHHTKLYYGIKREAFNAKYDRLPEVIEAEKSAAAYALTNCGMPTVVDRMFWPGADGVFEWEGKTMLNSYHPSGVEPCETLDEEGEAVIDMFLRHLAFVVEDPREQRIILDWMTFVYQNPGQRVNWALLIQGAQGTGKSYFATVLQAIMGANVTNLDPTAIAGRFTGWAHGSLVVAVEEIRISGTNKFEVLDRMKPFISNSTIQIEEKGRDHRTVPNFTSYLMLTNHKDAIPLTEGDRRYCVIFGRVQSEEQLFQELGGEEGAAKYFEDLFDRTERRADALAHYFAHRELSEDFNPRGRAPATKAKARMQSLCVSPERMMVEDAISQCECGVINDSVLDISYLREQCDAEGIELPNKRVMAAVLLDMGYEQVEGRRIKVASTGRHHYIWYRVSGAQSTDSRQAKETVRQFYNDENFIPF